MEYSLIANSGIQFLVAEINIDLNSTSKLLFHEWFDEEEVQTNLEFAYQLGESLRVVRVSDLDSCRFLGPDGKLTVSEAEVIANPNIEILHQGDIDTCPELFTMSLRDRSCRFSSLLNQWLPLPYFELDGIGDFKRGPYNWVRCKIIPREGQDPKSGQIKADVLIAVDTRALYEDPDEYIECPAFVSSSEREKHFRLATGASFLLDFCSGPNSWIRNYLMGLVHGVSELEDIRSDSNDHKYAFLASYLLLVDYLGREGVMPSIRLARDRDVKQSNVEMIIDIGNSRTAALLFEEGDFRKVKQLRLQNFTFPLTSTGKLNRTQESFDMRVAFQKVSFGENTMRGSRQFVWPSIVRLGNEAEYLAHKTSSLAEGDEILSTYSSPKRYLWDTKARTEEWRCVKVDAKGKNEPPLIDGVSNFFNDDGSIDPDGLGIGLHYSRRTLMTLAFMEILSQAQVQINSPEYREHLGRLCTPRRLEKIILTCPTAMSKVEQLALHQSLKDALYVLNAFRGKADETSIPLEVKVVPELKRNQADNPTWIFDEATCSQFVYLYGRFSDTYLNNSLEFFNLYGKKRPEANGEMRDSIIIGSLDIGAGTSDIMVCKYEYDPVNKSRLKPDPLFWDSFNYAGDDMLKTLIENTLLQGRNGIFERELARRGMEESDIRRLLYKFFGDDSKLSFNETILRRDFNLQVCMPVISHFLDLLSREETYREESFDEVFGNNMPSEAVMARFEECFGFPLSEIRWTFDSRLLSTQIEHAMNDMLENVATLMYAYDCDIVILSGRPTSLNPIKDIFLKYFSVDPNRLVVLNKHRIGRWYYYTDEFGYLTNSKSVVPLGAMIGYLASNAGGINGFSLDLSALGEKLKPTTDFFEFNSGFEKNTACFITPETSTGEITVNSFPAYICCKQFDLPNYPARPFYVLDISESSLLRKVMQEHPDRMLTDSERQYLVKQKKERILEHCPLRFTIEREDYADNKENIYIADVTGLDGESIPANNFTLTIQSLNDPDCYWLDSGAFNINIKPVR